MNARLGLATCLLLLSFPAAAQGLAPLAPVTATPDGQSGSPEEAPVPLDALDDSLAQPSTARWTPAARIGAELGGGFLGILGGGLAAGGLSALLSAPVCVNESWPEVCVIAIGAMGATVGGAIGLPLGIRWGGDAAGGNGSVWAAGGGVVLGTLLVGLAAQTRQPHVVVPALLSIPLLGVVGYELTDSAPAGLAPVVGLGPGGGTIAMQGRF